MFLTTSIARRFVSLPWCGSLVPITTIATSAITNREVVTITSEVADLGNLKLVETIHVVERFDGLIVMWIDREVIVPITTRTMARRAANEGAMNATRQRQQEPALTH